MAQMNVKPTRAELKAMAAALGRRGGLKKSAAKTAACRENAKKPRPNRRNRTEVKDAA